MQTMAQAFLSLCFGILRLCQALPSPDETTASAVTPQVIYEFPPTMPPENCILRPNGQLLVTCIICPTLSQLDPSKGPGQERRTVFEFPDGVINVLGIDELSKDIYAVSVGQLNVTDPFDVISKDDITGPTGVWVIDLREYQAPHYNRSLVKAHRVGGPNLGGLYDGLTVINGEKGLVATTDFVEGNIWLVDIPNSRTTILAHSPLLADKNGNLTSLLLANGLKYRDSKLFFTASATGTYGSVPIDSSTGNKTGHVEIIYDYGFSLDDFNFGPTGNAYLTTFAKPNGGVLRRAAGTPKGQSGTEKILSYFGTNSIIPRNVGDRCEFIMTVIFQFQVARFSIPGPC